MNKATTRTKNVTVIITTINNDNESSSQKQ